MTANKERLILIVDDNADDRKIFVRYLQQAGFITKEASSVLEGMAILLNEKVDCALVDYRMPSSSGIEMVKKIRANYKLKYIPVIILTGLEEEKYVLEGLEAGANDYVGKSRNEAVIVARVKSAIRIKELEDELRQRASELENKIAELEEMNKMFVNRELAMIQLKQQVQTLESQLKVKKTIAGP